VRPRQSAAQQAARPFVKPQGTEIAGNPHTLNGRVLRSNVSSAGRQRRRILLQLRNPRCGDGRRRRDQQIHFGEEIASATPFPIQLLPPLNIFRRRNLFRPSESAAPSRLVQLRRPRNILRVISVRLSRLHRAIRRNIELQIVNFRHQSADHGKRRVHRRPDFILKIVIKIRARNTDSKILRPLPQSGRIIAHRNIRAANVERIVSRNRLQHNRRIAHTRGQRTNMIERPRKRYHPPRRNASISRLEALRTRTAQPVHE